ncbi:hypothetical protein DSECCO2_564950 [anaerobic digester metagenome]
MKDYVVKISEKNTGVLAVLGHAGIGHVHSHSGFVQDDSAGFAVVASIMKEAFKVDTTIQYVTGNSETGSITVETYGGGIGTSHTRRGLTPQEVHMLRRAEGEDGIYTQTVAVKTFGRMYGQGAMETPVALQGAIALAVMDSFCKKFPHKILTTNEKYDRLIDKMSGTVVDINGIPISLLLNINGSEGGIGPAEDNEGNTALGQKGEIMKLLGTQDVPNIIVESKSYVPSLSKEINCSTFLFRGQEIIDNTGVAKALASAANDLSLPYILKNDSLPLVKGSLENATKNFAREIIKLGERLSRAQSAIDKTSIIAEIARMVSEDAGGISFMSNDLHDTARAAGIVPGTASVMSLLVPEDYINYWKIPVLTSEDVEQYMRIIFCAAKKLISEC